MRPVLDRLRTGLIVSCQAYPGEPLCDPSVTARMAQAVVLGGAVAVRVQGISDIRNTVAAVDVPVIGLWKVGHEDVYITPTLRHAREVASAGADIVAVDGTRRPRPDGLSLRQTIAELRNSHDVVVMADCGSLDDAVAAAEAGADLIGTTLAGYTGERPMSDGPDLELVRLIAEHVDRPSVAEGRIRTPRHAAQALEHGAYSVCIGTAITHPTSITTWFAEKLPTAPVRISPPGRR